MADSEPPSPPEESQQERVSATQAEKFARAEALTAQELKKLLWWAKLKTVTFRGRIVKEDAEDLMQDALLRSITTRTWHPRKIDFLTLVGGCMSSIASKLTRPVDTEPVDDTLRSPVDEEAKIHAALTVEKVLERLSEHPHALKVFNLQRKGCTAGEIQEILGITANDYDAARQKDCPHVAAGGVQKMSDHPPYRNPASPLEELANVCEAIWDVELPEDELDPEHVTRARAVAQAAIAKARAASASPTPPPSVQEPSPGETEPSGRVWISTPLEGEHWERDIINYWQSLARRIGLSQEPPIGTVSLNPGRRFLKRIGLHPAVVFLLLVLELVHVVWKVITVTTIPGVKTAFIISFDPRLLGSVWHGATIPFALIAGSITWILQMKYYDREGIRKQLFIKALVAALLTMFPFNAAILFALGTIGTLWNVGIYRRQNVEVRSNHPVTETQAPGETVADQVEK